MRDALGNKIKEGALLWMLSWGVVAKVTRVEDGGLSIVGPKGGGITPPVLTVSVDLPMDTSKLGRGEEPWSGSIICVIDPRLEGAVEAMLKQ